MSLEETVKKIVTENVHKLDIDIQPAITFEDLDETLAISVSLYTS